jgi:ABC-type tungstate transport system permease subunit
MPRLESKLPGWALRHLSYGTRTFHLRIVAQPVPFGSFELMQGTDLKIALLALLIVGALLSAGFGFFGWYTPQIIAVASTTSIKDSGLFDSLLPLFRQRTGIAVVVAAVGTAEALDAARRGEADVILVHAKPLEQQFIDQGDGVKRYPVMYNDFVLIGPKSDPAGIRGMTDVVQALSLTAS